MNDIEQFEAEVKNNISLQAEDNEFKELTNKWIETSSQYKYTYNFKWMGRPIIQFPQDIIAMQEIIWEVKPDLIIETGIAHGGSIIYYASLLELVGKGQVLGIDIDIREHNRLEIEKHPMFKRIQMIEGSSIEEDTINQVKQFSKNKERVIVILDSNHTHDHVKRELELYSSLVGKGSYLVVFDTAIEDMPNEFYKERPWGKGNNPKTAVNEFLSKNDRFIIDKSIENKLSITVAPSGYLKCIKDICQ